MVVANFVACQQMSALQMQNISDIHPVSEDMRIKATHWSGIIRIILILLLLLAANYYDIISSSSSSHPQVVSNHPSTKI